MEEKKHIDLVTLQDCISTQLEGMQAWIRAEIDSCKCSGGHWYLGLIQKSERGEELAKARAIIWRSHSGLLKYFREESGEDLKEGMEVLMFVEVNYDARFGMSLVIKDLDADFTTGQREKQRQQTLGRLEDENLMDRQGRLSLPMLPQHIAVISSADAAGYGDFTRQLAQNQYGFKFNYTLFPSLMQGDGCPGGIADAIAQICEEADAYDVILILRGGGAESDLFCYDHYDMCSAIASAPIPVLTAIGHERDYHIADMVAHSYFKTPTALAEFVIDWVAQVEDEVRRCVSNISFALNASILKMTHEVDMLSSSIKAADPRRILAQGYVLASDARGRIIKSADAASKGDEFRLRFNDGFWDCEIKETGTQK